MNSSRQFVRGQGCNGPAGQGHRPVVLGSEVTRGSPDRFGSELSIHRPQDSRPQADSLGRLPSWRGRKRRPDPEGPERQARTGKPIRGGPAFVLAAALHDCARSRGAVHRYRRNRGSPDLRWMVSWAGPLGPTPFLSQFLPDVIKSMGTPNVSNYRSWVLWLSRLVLHRG